MAAAAIAVHHDPAGQSTTNTRTIVTPPPRITSATLSRRSRQPVCLVASNDTTSDKTDAGGTDSGYATAESTSSSPEGKDSVTRDGSIASDIFKIQERKLFQRKVIRLREFDKTIPKVYHDRFADLCELLGTPLCDYLAKAKLKYKGIGMKLKALGESEETARPWIITLCDPEILKRVKRFFQEQWVKAECQPPNNDLPYFDIYFLNRAPKQHARSNLLDVHQNPLTTKRNPETLCGQAVAINHSNGFRAATLGGRIMVLKADGGLQAYALTAGHFTSDTWFLGGKPESNSSDDEHDLCEHGIEDELDSDSEIYELELAHDGKIDIEKGSGLHMQLPAITPHPGGQDQPSPEVWPKLGHIHATSCVADTANLDWALVTIDRTRHQLPNRIEDSSKVHSFWAGGSFHSSLPTAKLASDRSAIVMAGPEYPQRHGRLSDSTSFVLLAPGNQFVRVYDLKFSDGPALKPGDCGAWAIDSSTDEVYGHVVASDVLGEAYVIPLSATFKDIRIQLGALGVFLPSEHVLPTPDWEPPYSDSSVSDLLTEPASSTSTATTYQECDTALHLGDPSHKKNPTDAFQASEKVQNMPIADCQPFPDSGYASQQTSGLNSLGGSPGGGGPPNHPPVHRSLGYTEYETLYSKPGTVRTRSYEVRRSSQQLRPSVSDTTPVQITPNRRNRIKSWLRWFYTNSRDSSRERPTLHG